MTLHPEHLEDLRCSGLTDETIERYHVESVRPGDLGRELGGIAARITSAYRIPYPNSNGFARYKIFPSLDGQKYHQARRTEPHLFITHTAEKARTDPRLEIWITEGEKKCLAAEQIGIAAIAIGGLWSWRKNGKALSDWDRFDWCERSVILAPDSDVWVRPDLVQAVFALGKELESRGAKIKVIKLPVGNDAEKIGLDDFLTRGDDLAKIPHLELKHSVFSKAREWWREWKKEKPQSTVGQADPEPAADPVDGTELLRELETFVLRYIAMAKDAALAAALWLLHSYTLDAFPVSPILAIISPMKRCGKSTLLSLLLALARRPLPASNITPAAIFRAVEKFRPTLMVDEADTFLRDGRGNDRDELRGVINSSHYRPLAYVVRVVGDEHEPRKFSTWCPKAIALIGRLPDTLADRSITIQLRRRAVGEPVKRLRIDAIEPEAAEIRRRLARWAKDSFDALHAADPDVPSSLHDRAMDNWRPLIAIADLCHAGDQARSAARSLAGTEEDDSAATMLLEDIEALFEQEEAEAFPSQFIVDHLAELEGRPWPEWKAGRPMTVRQLARLLGPFSVRPDQIWLDGRKTRGYRRDDFAEAFSRYIPVQSGRSGRTQQNQSLTGEIKSVGNNGSTDLKSSVSPTKQMSLPDLPDETPDPGGRKPYSAPTLSRIPIAEIISRYSRHDGGLDRCALEVAMRRETGVSAAMAEGAVGLALEIGSVVEQGGRIRLP